MKLIELSEEYMSAINHIIENCDDYSIDEIENILKPINDPLEKKIQNLGMFLIKMEKEIDEMVEQEKIIKQKMREKIEKMENSYENIKNYLKYNMNITHKKSIRSPIIDITIRSNPPKTIIEDSSIIPSEYIKQKFETVIDKTLIKKDIKSGKLVPGAYIQESESLIIKSVI